jgi:lipoprotein-releasing system permease protein
MIVLQKTRDIAILRSVGFRRKDILLIFLLQGLMVALLGALVGDLLGWRVVALFDRMYDPHAGYAGEAQLRVVDDIRSYGWGALFAVLVGAVASLLPAWRGGQVEPVDVLRGQLG